MRVGRHERSPLAPLGEVLRESATPRQVMEGRSQNTGPSRRCPWTEEHRALFSMPARSPTYRPPRIPQAREITSNFARLAG